MLPKERVVKRKYLDVKKGTSFARKMPIYIYQGDPPFNFPLRGKH